MASRREKTRRITNDTRRLLLPVTIQGRRPSAARASRATSAGSYGLGAKRDLERDGVARS